MINLNSNYEMICGELLTKIKTHKSEIVELLSEVETYNMSSDEIICSIDLLENLYKQDKYICRHYKKTMCSFLPLNQPLYSLMLQVIVPSIVLENVYYRPPVLLEELHKQIYSLICSDICKNIHICNVERKVFINQYVLNCDIVNFTGKYKNALELIEKLPPDLSMIYNGSAVNPIIVTATGNMDLAVKDVVNARLYNSGQDCMAPAVIFVERAVESLFLDKLKNFLKTVIVGDNLDFNTTVGNLLEKKSIEEYLSFKKNYKKNLVLDATIDFDKNIMSPAIFHFDSPQRDVQNIYFAPYFIIMGYDKIIDIQNYLDTQFCELYSGYISIYTSAQSTEYIGYKWKSGDNILIPLINHNLLEEENGNKEFGGYGKGCSFVYKNGVIKAQPILLLRALNDLFDR